MNAIRCSTRCCCAGRKSRVTFCPRPFCTISAIAAAVFEHGSLSKQLRTWQPFLILKAIVRRPLTMWTSSRQRQTIPRTSFETRRLHARNIAYVISCEKKKRQAPDVNSEATILHAGINESIGERHASACRYNSKVPTRHHRALATPRARLNSGRTQQTSTRSLTMTAVTRCAKPAGWS